MVVFTSEPPVLLAVLFFNGFLAVLFDPHALSGAAGAV